jgi:hypothetical protein
MTPAARPSPCDPQPVEGTILIDWGARGCAVGVFADVTLDPDIRVQVGWDGLIQYACRGAEPDRVWWFAGTGEVREWPGGPR